MENRRKRIAYIKLAILIFIIVGLPVILFFTCRDTLFNKEWLANLPEFIMQYKGYAAAVLSFALPLLIMAVGAIYSEKSGITNLAVEGFQGVGAFIGAFIAFYIARALGKDSLEAIFGEEKVNDYHRKLNSGKGLTAVLLIYLIPGVPKDLVAYVAGISDMRLRPFLIVSTIGRSPGMLGSLLTGYFISSRNYAAIGVLAVLTAVILIICFVKRKQLVAMLDDLEKKDEQNHQ